MKYAIDFRSMHTAIHGLILFDTKEQAEENLGLLNECDDELVQFAFDNSCSVIDEVDYRELEEEMHDVEYCINIDGYVHPIHDDITIINFNDWVDVYC